MWGRGKPGTLDLWLLFFALGAIATFYLTGWKVLAALRNDDSETLARLWFFPDTAVYHVHDEVPPGIRSDGSEALRFKDVYRAALDVLLSDEAVRRSLGDIVLRRLAAERLGQERKQTWSVELIPPMAWPTVIVEWPNVTEEDSSPQRLTVHSGGIVWSYFPAIVGDAVRFGPLPAFPGKMCAVWEGMFGSKERCQEITVEDVLHLFEDFADGDAPGTVPRWSFYSASRPRFIRLQINAEKTRIRADDGQMITVKDGDWLGPLDDKQLEHTNRLRFFADTPWGTLSAAAPVLEQDEDGAPRLSVHLSYLNDTRLTEVVETLVHHIVSMDEAFKKQDADVMTHLTPALRDAYALYFSELKEGMSTEAGRRAGRDALEEGFPSWRLVIERARLLYEKTSAGWVADMRIRLVFPPDVTPVVLPDTRGGSPGDGMLPLRARLIYQDGHWLVDDLVLDDALTAEEKAALPNWEQATPFVLDERVLEPPLTMPTWQMMMIGIDRPSLLFSKPSPIDPAGEERFSHRETDASLQLLTDPSFAPFLSLMQATGTRLFVKDLTWATLGRKLIEGDIDIALGGIHPQETKDWVKYAEASGRPAPILVALFPRTEDHPSAQSPDDALPAAPSQDAHPLWIMVSGVDVRGLPLLLEHLREAGYAYRVEGTSGSVPTLSELPQTDWSADKVYGMMKKE
ncbi:MAG: hypothetical protein IMX04_01230 [Candidatus Carbobacillus altaicus]|nr:hypothetical protein [Candidatus Carbobacillus altaicus]